MPFVLVSSKKLSSPYCTKDFNLLTHDLNETMLWHSVLGTVELIFHSTGRVNKTGMKYHVKL